MEDLFKVGTSAAGRRPKAVIAISDKTGEVRSGQTTLSEEYRHYLIKFDEKDDFPRTRVEMAYYLMAIDAGIQMMPSRPLEIDGSFNFLTERYDRVNGEKIHTQTLFAMTGGSKAYEGLFEVARKLSVDDKQKQELFRRMVFNVMTCNVDDHDKNFSFMMDRDGVWKISPAYDLTFCIDNKNTLTGDLHAMSVNGKNRQITNDDLLEFASMNDIAQAQRVLDNVLDVVKEFRSYAAKTGVPKKWVDEIELTIKERKALGRGLTRKK